MSLKWAFVRQRGFFSRRTFANVSDRVKFARKHLNPGTGRLLEVEMASGKGAWLTAVNGDKYLDFSCGIGVTNLGHSHPDVVKAAQEQVNLLTHGQVAIFLHKPMIDLTQRLIQITPKGLDCVFYANSGSEAVEAAIKVARNATKKQNIIAFRGGYHGRTVGALSVTSSKTIYGGSFGPLMPGVYFAPFPFCHHCGIRKADKSLKGCCNDPLGQLELLFKQQTTPSDTAAVIIEPVLGEGGYVPPPPDFLRSVKDICAKNKVLMIIDEVQSGMGRTGKYFSVEHFDVVPDILIFAKGIANGFPLSGIVSSQELMKDQAPGSMGGTYTGNAVACAAACAVLDVFERDNILANVVAREKELKQHLHRLQQKYGDVITDVRGLGLMQAMEFKSSLSGIASRISKACLQEGLVLLTTSVFEVLRFIPPLNITSEELNTGMKMFEQALSKELAKH